MPTTPPTLTALPTATFQPTQEDKAYRALSLLYTGRWACRFRHPANPPAPPYDPSTHLSTRSLTNLPLHSLAKPTHPLTHPPRSTHPATYPPTHRPTNQPATDGPTWVFDAASATRATGWMASTDPCSYDKVTCNSAQEVVGLDLYGADLEGHLPTEIGDLTSLSDGVQGFLGNNYFGSSTLPTEIGRLSAMKRAM